MFSPCEIRFGPHLRSAPGRRSKESPVNGCSNAFHTYYAASLFRSFSHRSMSLWQRSISKPPMWGKRLGKPQLFCHPMIALRPRHTSLAPETVKDLMRFFSLQPKRFVGQITERPCGAFMTADAGVAVLALIEFLPFDAETPCRCRSVDLRSRGQTDNTAAIAADLRDLQMQSPPSCRFRCGRLSRLGYFLFRGWRAHDILQVIGVLCADGQHSALRDARVIVPPSAFRQDVSCRALYQYSPVGVPVSAITSIPAEALPRSPEHWNSSF